MAASARPVGAAARLAALVRRAGRRRTLVMLDQGLSSLSNVVVTIAVARLLAPAPFGAFSVAMVAYQLALSGVRAVVGEPWLSGHSADPAPARRRLAGDLASASLASATVASLTFAAAAAALGTGAVSGALLALAAVFPFLALQDGLRYVAVVDRPWVAVASDLVWLVAVAVLVVFAPAGASAAWFVGAWGVAGAAGLVVSLAQLAVPVGTGSAVRWFRRHRAMAGAFLAESVSARGLAQLVLLGLGAIAGLSAVGALRAAQVFYGPLNTLFSGAYLVLVPDGVRRRDAPGRLLRLMVAASIALGGLAGLWTLVGLVLPDRWGTALFGATWAQAQDVLLPMGLAVVASSVTGGAFAGIRSLAMPWLSLRSRLWSSPPQALGALVGALAGGAVGYAAGFAAGNAAVAAIRWSFFLAALRRRAAKHFPPDGRRPRRFVADGVAAKHATVRVTTGSSR